MQRRGYGWMVWCLVLGLGSMAGAGQSQISYTLTDWGGGSWQYEYTVSNLSLAEPMQEFTVYFDYGKYQNLTVATPAGLGWNEMVWQPDAVIHDAGGYDALTLGTGILSGEAVSGFAVRFDWLGTGRPGAQAYEIINPTTFATIDAGVTVPEPGTLAMLVMGAWMASRLQTAKRKLKT